MSANLIKGLIIAVLVLITDQYSKNLIINHFAAFPEAVFVLENFNLLLVFNKGVSFGLFASNVNEVRYALIGIALLITCLLIWWLSKTTTGLSFLGFGLIIGGAIGNILDRIFFGAVIDFLDIHIFGYHWPTFNLADSAICAGTILLIVESLTEKNKFDK